MLDFSSTHWSQVRNLRGKRPRDEPELGDWEQAWTHLMRKYEPAMQSIARRRIAALGGGAVRSDQAEDVVQAFIAKCLERDWFHAASEEFGTFRGFVFVLIKRFTRDYIRAQRAQKRAPGSGIRSLDTQGEIPGNDAALDEKDNESWMRCVLVNTVDRVRRRSPTNAAVGALLIDDPTRSNAELALRSGLNEDAITLAKHRCIKMFAQEARPEVAETVRNLKDYEEEVRLIETYTQRFFKDRGPPQDR